MTHKEELSALSQLRRLGVDPFDETLNGDFLFRFTRASERRIRDLLLDQQIVAGLGNIYANEVLAMVRVKPTTRAWRLTRKQVGMIAAAIRNYSMTRFNGAARRSRIIATPTISPANFKIICVSTTARANPAGFAPARSSESPSATAVLFIVRHVKNERFVAI